MFWLERIWVIQVSLCFNFALDLSSFSFFQRLMAFKQFDTTSKERLLHCSAKDTPSKIAHNYVSSATWQKIKCRHAVEIMLPSAYLKTIPVVAELSSCMNDPSMFSFTNPWFEGTQDKLGGAWTTFSPSGGGPHYQLHFYLWQDHCPDSEGY